MLCGWSLNSKFPTGSPTCCSPAWAHVCALGAHLRGRAVRNSSFRLSFAEGIYSMWATATSVIQRTYETFKIFASQRKAEQTRRGQEGATTTVQIGIGYSRLLGPRAYHRHLFTPNHRLSRAAAFLRSPSLFSLSRTGLVCRRPSLTTSPSWSTMSL